MTYIGRFAPTPSGPLHLGSLFTALASYLDAKHHQGHWLVRIEDLDQPRCIPGAAADILRTLEQFGLHWDGPVLYQSERTELYRARLHSFAAQPGNTLYPCTCTRRKLQLQGGGPYPGNCRPTSIANKPDTADATSASATRWWIPEPPVRFIDRIMGHQSFTPALQTGDPVLLRKDGFFAYHWAVVIDDALQSVSHIVRGLDLLDQTSIHLALQSAGQFPQPYYAHVPLILGADGKKLSKSERAASLQTTQPNHLLTQMLVGLGQLAPKDALERQHESILKILEDAAKHWDITRVPKTPSLSAHFLIA